MADGSIVFDTELDDKQTQKELTALEKKIDRLNEKAYQAKQAKLPLEKQALDLGAALDGAKQKLDALQSGGASSDVIKEQSETVASLQYRWDQVNDRIDRYNATITTADREIEAAKREAGGLAAYLAEAGKNAGKMNAGVKKAAKSADAFSKRIKAVVRSALVFTVITQALSKLRNWAGDVIKASPEAAAAIAQLKGALLTLVQPLVDILIPAFVTLVQVLTAVVAKIAQLVAAVSGKSLAASAASARALSKQTKALNSTGKAAKNAGKSLAAFDEINQLSSGSSGGSSSEEIAPDFSFLDGVSERMGNIARDVALIGAGLALWKVSDSLPGNLGLIAAKIAGVAVAVGGLLLMYDGLKDAWENGIDWTNFLEILAGAGALVGGLALAFGQVGAGIGLAVAGAALIVTAFRDIEKNGVNLKNVLMLITSLLAAGLGISVLTGSWVPLMIAAIAGIVTAMLAWTGNLGEFIDSIKGVFSGLVQFIKGVFTGDMKSAFEGLKKVFKNLINADIILVESFVNTVIRALNWLIRQINKISFDVPSWVPGIGGKSFGINIPSISEKKLPRLATGAVIPPNREFMAVLGDQKSGTNIETPEALLRQIYREETGANTQLLQAILDAVREGKVLVVNDRVLAKVLRKSASDLSRAEGTSFVPV